MKGSIFSIILMLVFGMACGNFDLNKLKENNPDQNQLTIKIGDQEFEFSPQNISITNKTTSTITLNGDQQSNSGESKTINILLANYGKSGDEISEPAGKNEFLIKIDLTKTDQTDKLEGEYFLKESTQNENSINSVNLIYIDGVGTFTRAINPNTGEGSLKITSNSDGTNNFIFNLKGENRTVLGSITK